MKNLLRAFHFFRADRGRILVVFALLVTSVCLNILKPWPLALIVDCVLGKKPFPQWLDQAWSSRDPAAQLSILVLALLALFLGQAILSSAQLYLSIDIGLRGLMRVRNAVFDWLQRLSLRFHRGHRVGDLIYRAATDTYAFQTLFQQGVIALFSSSLTLIFIVTVMWRVNRLLTLVALAIVPLLVLTIKHFGRQMRLRGLQAQKAESTVMSLIQQGILALPLIQSFTREAHEQGRFSVQSALARQFKLSQHTWEVLYGFMISISLALGTTAITWLGARQVLAGNLTLGELLVFLAYLTQMLEPLNQLTYIGSTVASSTAGVERVFEILDTPEEVTNRPDARPIILSGSGRTSSNPPPSGTSGPVTVQGNVSFDRVSFGYEEKLPVLHEISFQIQAGESVAVIGPSGAGKSTLLNLLPRFFDPNSGTVALEGIDLRQLRLHDLRTQIALLHQEPIILAATAAENIAYGKPGASAAEIEAAAEAANAHEFIQKLPQGFDTLIGESGAGLSVGEKQRISLARAFLKDAPILLLDEPTSALDTESEAMIVQSLTNLMKDRTTLMVAHRLSTIRRVDKILTLQNGRVREFGPPAELLRQGGYYSSVVGGQVAL